MTETDSRPAPPEPFAARESALARIHQHLVADSHTHALLLTGRAGTGKTALLRAFDSAFDPLNVWGLYLDLTDAPLHDESEWLFLLFTRAHQAALEHGFSAERLPVLSSAGAVDDLRIWLVETGFPELFRVIRGARRVVYLLDNAGALLDALTRGDLPADHLTYLRGLLGPQLSIVLTAALDDEPRLHQLAPLVNPLTPFRLSRFSPDETRRVVEAVTGEPAADSLAQEVYKAAGGQPLLTRRMADRVASGADAYYASEQVYDRESRFFRQQWESLNDNERRVLSAAAALIYADPLVKLNAAALETWLVDSDAPLDLTGIQAALRGLEYHEMVELSAQGVAIRGDLMRRWLLENARRPASIARRTVPPSMAALEPARESAPRWVWIALAAAVLVALVVLALLLAPDAVGMGDALPTVTLNTTP